MILRCEFCGALITRRRGNLRSMCSLRRAINALLSKHVARYHPSQISRDTGRLPYEI
jgi:phage FluMu protein Com